MTDISAQKILNGEGFDDEYMLEKAERELVRVKSCKNPLFMYDHFINFSITLASVADWKFHLNVANTPKWKNKNEINFCNWVRSQSPEVATFIDISNECKHANRKHPNFIAEKILTLMVWDTDPDYQNIVNIHQEKGFFSETDGGKIFFVAFIKYGENQIYFFDVAEAALAWWRGVNLEKAIPMDKDLNELP